MVLLKNNNNALPFPKTINMVALFGINGYELIAGGTGSGDVNKAYKVSLSQDLFNAGYTADEELRNIYTTYLNDEHTKNPKKSFFEEFKNPTPPVTEYLAGNDLISKKATESDIAIIAIGRNAGEARDRKPEDDFNLSDTEKILIKNVSGTFHAQNKKVIVVLNIGGVIEVASWRDDVDAILLAWQPGLEGGNAITELLSGKANPSGKLAVTFPLKYNDVPSAKTFPGKEFPEKEAIMVGGFTKAFPAEVTYDEGIYVGYRYYNTYNIKSAYDFGYGLSYTNFSYSNLKLSSATFNNNLTASFVITNTGNVEGKEVAQLYISALGVNKPSEELKAFAKTHLLKPGESEKIIFKLSSADLASFNTQKTS